MIAVAAPSICSESGTIAPTSTSCCAAAVPLRSSPSTAAVPSRSSSCTVVVTRSSCNPSPSTTEHRSQLVKYVSVWTCDTPCDINRTCRCRTYTVPQIPQAPHCQLLSVQLTYLPPFYDYGWKHMHILQKLHMHECLVLVDMPVRKHAGTETCMLVFKRCSRQSSK